MGTPDAVPDVLLGGGDYGATLDGPGEEASDALLVLDEKMDVDDSLAGALVDACPDAEGDTPDAVPDVLLGDGDSGSTLEGPGEVVSDALLVLDEKMDVDDSLAGALVDACPDAEGDTPDAVPDVLLGDGDYGSTLEG